MIETIKNLSRESVKQKEIWKNYITGSQVHKLYNQKSYDLLLEQKTSKDYKMENPKNIQAYHFDYDKQCVVNCSLQTIFDYGNEREPIIRELFNKKLNFNCQDNKTTYLDKELGISANIDGIDSKNKVFCEIKSNDSKRVKESAIKQIVLYSIFLPNYTPYLVLESKKTRQLTILEIKINKYDKQELLFLVKNFQQEKDMLEKNTKNEK